MIDKIDTIETSSSGYPSVYDFSMEKPAFSCWFTRTGRVRNRLWKTYLPSGDAKQSQLLMQSLIKLKNSKQKSKTTIKDVICQCLLYLVWSNLRKKNFSEACKWLTHLHEDFPNLPAKLSLRWQLVNAMFTAKNNDNFVQECKNLIADSLLDGRKYTKAILGLVHTLYEKLNPSVCREVISKAHKLLANSIFVQMVTALCNCPEQFKSAEEADLWASKIPPQKLNFSLAMKADALVIAARTAEWAGQWKSMEDNAQQALKLLPNHVRAKYWIIRARLHIPNSNLTEGIEISSLSNESYYKRLQSQINLYYEPIIANIQNVIDALSEEKGQTDILEKELSLQMMKTALTLKSTADNETIIQFASVSESIEKFGGKLWWAQLNIAIRELRIEHKYNSAIQRLENEELQKDFMGRSLLRIARILAGNPLLSEDNLQEQLSLNVLEKAMYCLFNNENQQDESELKLAEELGKTGKDKFLDWVPEIRIVADILRFALLVNGNDKIREEIFSYHLPSMVSDWVSRLFTRVRFVICEMSDTNRVLEGLDTKLFSIAWEIEAWRFNYAKANMFSHDICQESSSAVSSQINQIDGYTGCCLRAIHAARLHRYSILGTLAEGNGAFPELRGLSLNFHADETKIELDYVAARVQLAGENISEAAKMFSRISKDLSKASIFTKMFWSPIIEYWEGVLAAHAGKENAKELLNKISMGPKALETKSQLAMLAIREGKLDEAENWLANVSINIPEILYAKALLLERKDDHIGASKILESDDAKLCMEQFANSPYVKVISQLAAVIRERQGEIGKAEELYSGILKTHPDDSITCARISRLRITRQYRNNKVMTSLEGQFLSNGAAVDWCRTYQLFYELLTASNKELSQVHHNIKEKVVPASSCAWLVGLAHRYLEFENYKDAHWVIEGNAAEPNLDCFMQTREILRAWEILTEPVESRQNKEASDKSTSIHIPEKRIEQIKQCCKTINSLLGKGENLVLRRWNNLLTFACKTIESPTDGVPLGLFADAYSKDSWPFWQIAEMWAQEPQKRKEAGNAILEILAKDASLWSQKQLLLLGIAATWVAGRNDEYLEHYERLRTDLPDFPFDARYLWLAAGKIWFSHKNYDKLLSDDLPACLADFSHPEVRLLMGLAIAASMTGTKDLQKLSSMIHQSREMLSPILTNTK